MDRYLKPPEGCTGPYIPPYRTSDYERSQDLAGALNSIVDALEKAGVTGKIPT